MSTYYVRSTGSDTYDGTASTHGAGLVGPKLTLAAGLSMLSTGDVLDTDAQTYTKTAPSMSLAEARLRVRQAASNAGDTTQYTDAQIDRSIQFAGNWFTRETKILRAVASLTLTSGSASLPALSFRPDLLVKAWISGEEDLLEVVDYATLSIEDAASGTPEKLAFTSSAAGVVWPTPSSNLTLKAIYLAEFPYWTPGGSCSDLLHSNEHLMLITDLGAPAHLQFPDPSKLFVSRSWQNFLIAAQRACGVRSVRNVMKKGE
ncbi:MAG: hypothetical protein ABFD89_03645 [Bryobacteraceae bacterium]